MNQEEREKCARDRSCNCKYVCKYSEEGRLRGEDAVHEAALHENIGLYLGLRGKEQKDQGVEVRLHELDKAAVEILKRRFERLGRPIVIELKEER